ncbi:putative lipoprotein YiaD [Ascidiaceihabitans donghaensis]|uniref:Putative lipoprotein YiaD n=1 Tax=Ascidiaceihabitans donghaensis TaxID=1510460 RepID=A0A2R8BBR4_9RHOB|nr:OmpA family protein [Ascidiaceihabitans donghaensis]SPH20488.1 putative lipoprotein YiaD [Ascidiaceihabitans donghaensis]
MGYSISKAVRTCLAATATIAVGLTAVVDSASAQGIFERNNAKTNERYVPTIWVDPDGCEHWVMDDGYEGYMSPHTNRQGIPVCRRGNVCGVMNSDQFFKTNSARISADGKARLAQFFQSAGAVSYIIVGHTDSRASDQYNMRLSFNRASAVAGVAQSAGARIADVRGYGERLPAASNKTAGGMAKNRRVEIICIR